MFKQVTFFIQVYIPWEVQHNILLVMFPVQHKFENLTFEYCATEYLGYLLWLL